MAAAPVLLLTHAFPPMWLPEATLAAKRMGALSDREVDVICTVPFGDWVGDDASLDCYVRQRFRSVVRVPAPRWPRKLLVRHVGALGRSPDEFRFANRRIVATARRRAPDEYGAIVSWSQWHSIHLAAMVLARDRRAPPWLAHFSDPWSTNPFYREGRLTRAINRQLEGRVLRSADRLLFTSEETVNLMLGDDALLRAKARVLPHAFDSTLLADAPDGRSTNGHLVVRYIGQFYGPRSPQPLFEGLRALLSARPDLAARLRVEIVGRVEPHLVDSPAARDLPQGLVCVRDPVPYMVSLGLIRDSDILLVIDAPMELSPFLPSKLVDYVGARRPIVGITPPGAAASLIAELGGWTADPRDPAGVAIALRRAVEHVERAGPAPFGDPTVRDRYEVRRVGRDMAAVIDEVAGESESSNRP